MKLSSLTYKYKPTPSFEKKLHKLEKKAPVRAKRIKKAIQKILKYPFENIDFGVGQWIKLREWRAGKDRIMGVVCKQCRELGHDSYFECGGCTDTPDETVTFVTIIEDHKF